MLTTDRSDFGNRWLDCVRLTKCFVCEFDYVRFPRAIERLVFDQVLLPKVVLDTPGLMTKKENTTYTTSSSSSKKSREQTHANESNHASTKQYFFSLVPFLQAPSFELHALTSFTLKRDSLSLEEARPAVQDNTEDTKQFHYQPKTQFG